MIQAILLVGLVLLLIVVMYYYRQRPAPVVPPSLVPPPKIPHAPPTDRQQEQQKQAQTTATKFSEAIHDLESETLNKRLGAMYVLESISRHSTDLYHWPVMHALNAYLHKHFITGLTDKNFPLDLETAFKMLGQRLISYEKHAKNEAIDDQKRIHLKDLDFSNISLKSFNFRGCRLDYMNMTGVDLKERDFFSSHLKGVILKQSNLSKINLIGAIVQDCDLSEANLSQAELIMTRLSEVDLRSANLKGANLRQAELKGTNLKGANLEKVTGLTFEQLKTALIDEKTVLPEALAGRKSELLRVKENAE